MAEPYEVNAAISLGRSDPGQIVEQYLKLLTDILRFLDIREKLSRIFPDTEGSMAIRNIKQYLKPSLDNILELEGNYKLQKLCIDACAKHREKAVQELQK